MKEIVQVKSEFSNWRENVELHTEMLNKQMSQQEQMNNRMLSQERKKCNTWRLEIYISFEKIAANILNECISFQSKIAAIKEDRKQCIENVDNFYSACKTITQQSLFQLAEKFVISLFFLVSNLSLKITPKKKDIIAKSKAMQKQSFAIRSKVIVRIYLKKKKVKN
ncbi:hypothetical protein RFI_09823 [Reticulomyxa filosa]|uniref:Uncharacterized protein n=1 Tax=Reticulomyxa filosa TaxID=46433 RepID=X6NMT1_RETFI|nr:hypothetical protein RFI_09823 [Reticulomyxa filosa]|eukprot:ETO27311.1 hypothetical protein RFI_09823 [Reticulomyxa filosa]